MGQLGQELSIGLGQLLAELGQLLAELEQLSVELVRHRLMAEHTKEQVERLLVVEQA